jgi:hypothetical protein
MWEVAGSRQGVVVVVMADPRQVYTLQLLAPFSTLIWRGEGLVAGCWLATPIISTSPCYRRGVGGKELWQELSWKTRRHQTRG